MWPGEMAQGWSTPAALTELPHGGKQLPVAPREAEILFRPPQAQDMYATHLNAGRNTVHAKQQ